MLRIIVYIGVRKVNFNGMIHILFKISLYTKVVVTIVVIDGDGDVDDDDDNDDDDGGDDRGCGDDDDDDDDDVYLSEPITLRLLFRSSNTAKSVCSNVRLLTR